MNKIIALFIFALGFAGCTKDNGCYSKRVKKNHSGICQDDCPGYCGCNGVFYCNECNALTEGIIDGTPSNGPCPK